VESHHRTLSFDLFTWSSLPRFFFKERKGEVLTIHYDENDEKKDSDVEDACIAFKHNEETPWSCLDDTKLVDISNGLMSIRSNTTHFTLVSLSSFAGTTDD